MQCINSYSVKDFGLYSDITAPKIVVAARTKKEVLIPLMNDLSRSGSEL
jgi:hypothetical protein